MILWLDLKDYEDREIKKEERERERVEKSKKS